MSDNHIGMFVYAPGVLVESGVVLDGIAAHCRQLSLRQVPVIALVDDAGDADLLADLPVHVYQANAEKAATQLPRPVCCCRRLRIISSIYSVAG